MAAALASLVAVPLYVAVGSAPATASSDALVDVDRGFGSEQGVYEGPGDRVQVRVWDSDLPRSALVTTARLTSTSDPVGIAVRLERDNRASAYFRGRARFTTGLSLDLGDQLSVADGDTVTATYLDPAGSTGSPRVVTATATWVLRTHTPDSRQVVYGDVDPERPAVEGAPWAATPGSTVRVYTVGGTVPLGSAEAGTDGSFMVTFPGPAPESVDLEAQTDGVPASRRLTERRARALGRVVVPEPGDPPMENAYLALSPTAGTAPCSGYRCGVHAIADRAGRVAFNSTELTDSSAYEMVGVPSGSEPTLDAKEDLYNEAYADSTPSQVAIPVSGPTVELPVAVLTGPNLTGMSRDSLGALLPDVEIWGSNDRGEPLSGDSLRNFGNRRGRYGVHLADGRWRIDPRPPRGCDPMATDAFDVVVTAGTAVPNVVDLTWRVAGLPVDTTITLARLRETGSSLPVVLDMSSPAGDLMLSFSDLTGAGSVSAGCRSATLPVGPGGEIPIDLPVVITPSGLSFDRAELCLPYVPERAAAAGVPESGLRLLHERQDGSTEILSSVVDTVSRQVCATTTSFSAFAVGGRATTTTTSPTTSTTTTSTSTSTTTMSTTTTSTPPSPTSTSPTTSTPRPTSPVTSPAPPVPPPTTVSRSGYWMVGADGIVYGFGDARRLGDAPVGSAPAVDLEPTPSGEGYWAADAQGHVFSAGDARYLGGANSLAASETVTSLSATPTGRGYWLFTTKGRALAFGDAGFFGDMGGTRLNGPVLDSIPTSSGRGYYMVSSDGGVFAFGDARFHGSMGAASLNAPVQSLVPDPDGSGYWLVAADGGIFSFAAEFFGSMGRSALNRPITGMVGFRRGYLMVGEDGGIFAFGDARFHGSLGDRPPGRPIVSVAALPTARP